MAIRAVKCCARQQGGRKRAFLRWVCVFGGKGKQGEGLVQAQEGTGIMKQASAIS